MRSIFTGMSAKDLPINQFLKKHSLLGKVLVILVLTSLFATLQIGQHFGWSRATGREIASQDVLRIYSGYLLLAFLSVSIFLWHTKVPIRKSNILKATLLHLGGAMVFAFVHSLLFSLGYYLLNPAWQAYPFHLLLKDVAFNYFNTSLLFYLLGLLFSEFYNKLIIQNKQHQPPTRKTLKVRDQKKTYLFPIHEIAYFTSADNYVKVHCGKQAVLMRESMASLEKQLDPQVFLRVHRTALINKNYVSQIVRKNGEISLIMTDENILPVSRRRKEARQLLEQAD